MSSTTRSTTRSATRSTNETNEKGRTSGNSRTRKSGKNESGSGGGSGGGGGGGGSGGGGAMFTAFLSFLPLSYGSPMVGTLNNNKCEVIMYGRMIEFVSLVLLKSCFCCLYHEIYLYTCSILHIFNSLSSTLLLLFWKTHVSENDCFWSLP